MNLRRSSLARTVRTFVLLYALLCPFFAAAQQPGDRPLLGFDRASTVAERALEARFDATLKAEDLRTWMKRLSARPHHIGSPYGKENAEFIAAQFRAWGFATQIEEFSVLFPTPKTRVVELLSPEKFTAGMIDRMEVAKTAVTCVRVKVEISCPNAVVAAT